MHLPGGWSPQSVSAVRAALVGKNPAPVVSVSCHTFDEAALARRAEVDLALYAPVFGKQAKQPDGAMLPGQGLEQLARFCRAAAPVPVFALGGVNGENALACLEAGAQGIAGIRLFLAGNWRRLAG